MMKEKFLKDLEKKLEVISEEERKDTINEYRDIIEEKVKHGKTEDEAIEEFGNIDELAKEILKAYKINPDYGKNNTSSTSEFIKETEEVISKAAKKLSDITEEVADSFKRENKEFTTSSVFEMIIKVILILLGLAILKLPFYMVSEIGVGIFEIGPFSGFTTSIWKLFVEIIYLVVCILLIMSIVNQYTSKGKKKINQTNQSEGKKIEDKMKKERKSSDPFGNFLMILVKIWCLIIIIIPAICFEVGCVIAISFIIYFIIKGISIYGFLLLVLGIFGIVSFIIDVIWKLVFSRKNIYVYPMIISICFVMLGSLLSFDYITNLTFINEIPKEYNTVTNTYEIRIDEDTDIHNFIQKEIDDTLDDNVLKFEITYCDDIYSKVEPVLSKNDDEDYIYITHHLKNNQFKLNSKYMKMFFDDLKNNEIYNYSKLSRIDIKIYSNSNTSDMID